MTENNTAQRPRQETDRKAGKRQQRALQWVTAHREEQRAKYQRRRGAVEEKVIPLQRIAQHRGHHQLTHLLRIVAGFGGRDYGFRNDITHPASLFNGYASCPTA